MSRPACDRQGLAGGRRPCGCLLLQRAQDALAGAPIRIGPAEALLLGLDATTVVAVVLTASLPTAQNIFIIASRYRRAETLARDSVLLTTLASVPVIVGAVLVLG